MEDDDIICISNIPLNFTVKNSIPIVTEKWILDSISQYKKLNMKEYLLGENS